MEVVGVAAAAITFGALILKVSKKLGRAAKEIRYARREILKLVKEMRIFSHLYEDFHKVCISEPRRKGRINFSTSCLVSWIEEAIAALKNLLHRVRALAGDPRYSTLEIIAAHVKWFFSPNEVNFLRRSLTVARENMMGFSNLTYIEAINKEIQLIKNAIAQGDKHTIQELEYRFKATLGEKLEELKQTRLVPSYQGEALWKLTW